MFKNSLSLWLSSLNASRDAFSAGRDVGSAIRSRMRLKFGVICGATMLLAVPSFGSRVHDATLDKRSELILASLGGESPAARHGRFTEPSPPEPLRLARLDVDLNPAPMPAFGWGEMSRNAREALAEDLTAQPAGDPAMRDEMVDVAPRDDGLRLRPSPRPQALAAGVETRLSTQGAVAPLRLDSAGLSPMVSLRPKLRPAALVRQTVRYDRRWMQRISLRELDDQEKCLVTAIYHEARGESLKGQFAVAEVILNRVDSPAFPSTICGVVYQGVRAGSLGGCQFSFACDGRSEAMPNGAARTRAHRIAQVMVDGGHSRLTRGALYFHTTAVNPGWAQSFTQTTQIGAHLFYRG